MTPRLPPGLASRIAFAETSIGGKAEWLPFTNIKQYTNAFIVQDGKVLLGYKKRGFGKDLYNGFGGKVDPGETPAQAAVRELEEEAGITAALEHCGTLFFVSAKDTAHAFNIEIYRAGEFTGTITESDEMRPQWFSTSANEGNSGFPPIPYPQMWADDPYWLPLLLAGRHFAGRADFGEDERLCKWWFGAAHEA